jgi:hypothetical protein
MIKLFYQNVPITNSIIKFTSKGMKNTFELNFEIKLMLGSFGVVSKIEIF